MNLNQLEILVAIVDTGSLTEAGEAVGLTQSAVSHSLAKLEAELGVTLLERGRQGVTVTRIGVDVVQHARTILKESETIRQKTARERGLSVGDVRFGCVPSVPSRLLTGILRDFQHQYPEIDVTLFEGHSTELVDWLDNDIIDVGAVIRPDAFAYAVPFIVSDIQLVVSETHTLASLEYATFDHIHMYPLIGPKAEYMNFAKLAQMNNLKVPPLRYQVSMLSTIFAMLRQNMGISMMPDLLIDPQQEGIVRIPFADAFGIRVSLATHNRSPAIMAFMDNSHQWAKEHGFLESPT